MRTAEFIEQIERRGCIVFGTGFVAELFRDALAQANLSSCVQGYLVTAPSEGAAFDGLSVHAASDSAIDRSALICIAVHESNLASAEETLAREGFANTVWVYPFLHDLLYGEPLYRDVSLPLEMILSRQDPSSNWIAVRALAAQDALTGERAGHDTYVAAQALHCSVETAEKRYGMLCDLVESVRMKGFDPSQPVLVDTNLNIIDGLHRVAVAWVLGIASIPCQIVAANDAFGRLITESNRMPDALLAQAGLSQEQLATVHEIRSQMAPRAAAKPEITIIMPAYNVADYIDQCMESIVTQTFGDFEALLIDDGSTDGTAEKCDSWAARDIRIHAIHKPNSGVSPSRNLGIELARGTYLAFVDPDDWLDERYLELLHDAAEAEGADFAECDIWRYDNRSGKKIHRFCGQRMGVRYTLEEHMKYGPTASYKAISKRSLWVDNNVRFPDCSFESPAIYALILALAGDRSTYIPEPLYYYRRFRPASLVETAYAKAPGVADNTLGVDAMAHLIAQFKARGMYERFEKAMPGLVAWRLNDILAMQYHRRSAEDFAELVANQRRFLEQAFPQLPQGAYITWGGYNLNKILQHLPMLNDPSCRFNFSSIAAIGFEGTGGIVHHANRYREMMLQRELDQTFWTVLREQQPRFIFMDLIDDRFDLVDCGNRYLTASDAFDGASIEGVTQVRRIAFGSSEHLAIWREAFSRFVERLHAEAPQTRLIIVENYLSDRIGTLEKTREFEDAEGIRKVNRALMIMYGYARTACKDAVVISAFECNDYFTDEAYEYGALPQHLNDIVNQRVAWLIERSIIVVKGPS